jgi:hypothetical protein
MAYQPSPTVLANWPRDSVEVRHRGPRRRRPQPLAALPVAACS